MAHPYSRHSENTVGRRRAKLLLKSGGRAHDDVAEDKKIFKKMMASHERMEGEKHDGAKCGGRLDKKARGGAVKKFQMGGAVSGVRKPTPSKRKPHVSVNVINISRGVGTRRPPMSGAGIAGAVPGGQPPLPAAPPAGGLPGPIGAGGPSPGLRPPGMKRGGAVQKKQVGGAVVPRPVGLPVQANPRAAAALAARPALPTVARAVRPFAAGGSVKPASMRRGKHYGQGSGEGRLEEFKHMK